ncbi:MAG: hypothetical protein ACYC2H_04145 [Thermoplasmatota archaeon]
MAPNALLGLLATLLLFSGCLDAESPATELPTEAVAADPDATSPPPVAEALPKCPKGGQNNYGTSTQVGDEYVVSPSDGNVVVYYRESNGCSGLQTEGEWAHNPDTKVAEVPAPIIVTGPVPGKA